MLTALLMVICMSLCLLKKFISARRNFIKTPSSLKLKRLSSFKTNLLKKEGEMIDDEFEDEFCKNLTDLFVEIYAMPQEEKYHEQCKSQMNESLDVSIEYEYDMDKKSEFSQDEVDDVMMHFLESQIDCEEDGEIKKSEIDVNCGVEICFLDDNMEVSEFPVNQPSVNVIEKENFDISEFSFESINEEIQNLQSEIMNCQSDKNPEKELLDSSNGIDKNIPNVSDVVSNSKWRILSL